MSGPATPPGELGIGAGARLFLHEDPENYHELIAPLPAGVQTVPRIDARTDVIHVFATRGIRELALPTGLIRKTRRAAPGKLPRTRAPAPRPRPRS
ncbi:MAG TPA: hypothetical protein VGD47_11610 [Steroidobacteraceae bacterium]